MIGPSRLDMDSLAAAPSRESGPGRAAKLPIRHRGTAEPAASSLGPPEPGHNGGGVELIGAEAIEVAFCGGGSGVWSGRPRSGDDIPLSRYLESAWGSEDQTRVNPASLTAASNAA
jgi:hypothetical protein